MTMAMQEVTTDLWRTVTAELASGALTLVALWAEPQAISMAITDTGAVQMIRVLRLSAPDGRYPSVGAHHPPAIRLERAAADLYSVIPVGLPDPRPWLRHGMPYAFLPVEGENLHQVPVGPVHAGIIEPGHFRFTADGETVVRLEARLGYTHKGVEALMTGAPINDAARLASRVSGDSTVAYALAFAQAVEAAHGITAPPRALWLRALMAEMERLANHLGDVGAICNDAAFPIMLANCSVLRELVLRASLASFGHRLMMDRVQPGGVAVDLDSTARERISLLVENIRQRFRPLVALYENTASILDRTVSTGVLTHKLAAQFGVGGYVGRASGRAQDARRNPGYPPYDRLSFEVPTLTQGDVHSRLWIRVLEIEQALNLIEQVCKALPEGPLAVALPPSQAGSTGFALVEGFRGDIFAWLRLGPEGCIDHCHLRDPSWFQWPLLEAVIENNIIADFPLCNKSFNCSYSGADL